MSSFGAAAIMLPNSSADMSPARMMARASSDGRPLSAGTSCGLGWPSSSTTSSFSLNGDGAGEKCSAMNCRSVFESESVRAMKGGEDGPGCGRTDSA